jgi:CxxC motif-containing protein
VSFRPNTFGYLQRRLPKRDIHGREMFTPPQRIPLNVVRLEDVTTKSSVRADSSASRGAGDMETMSAVLMLPPNCGVVKGDIVTVLNRTVEVVSIHQRNDVFGILHHLDVGGDIKGNI